ncbi:FAD binding domain-containing protein [Pedobacter sp. AW1-32]|uniref:FAD binding domain-containing protein n=1 Tax=Pedobacter sp. AW1-32 TaxID=3383026 RepID=UPI003FF082E6
MKQFIYVKAATADAALKARKNTGSMFIAGGTNLIDLMKKGVYTPDKLVDITALNFKEIVYSKGKTSIGALAKNSQVAEHKLILEKHPLLALALAAGASQQIRHMATVGGNMLQKNRCGYYYNTDMPCNKRNENSGCGAYEGANRMHAIFGASENCIAVHPSDMCIALAALDAEVLISTGKTVKKMLFTDFHRLPGNTPHLDNNLNAGEMITAIEIPEHRFTKNIHYLKVRDRTSYAFALVSVAVALDLEGSTIRDVRIALGGVASKPWRLNNAEAFLKGKSVNTTIFEQAAALAMNGAKSYGENDFKLQLAPNSIVEALKIAAAKS